MTTTNTDRKGCDETADTENSSTHGTYPRFREDVATYVDDRRHADDVDFQEAFLDSVSDAESEEYDREEEYQVDSYLSVSSSDTDDMDVDDGSGDESGEKDHVDWDFVTDWDLDSDTDLSNRVSRPRKCGNLMQGDTTLAISKKPGALGTHLLRFGNSHEFELTVDGECRDILSRDLVLALLDCVEGMFDADPVPGMSPRLFYGARISFETVRRFFYTVENAKAFRCLGSFERYEALELMEKIRNETGLCECFVWELGACVRERRFARFALTNDLGVSALSLIGYYLTRSWCLQKEAYEREPSVRRRFDLLLLRFVRNVRGLLQQSEPVGRKTRQGRLALWKSRYEVGMQNSPKILVQCLGLKRESEETLLQKLRKIVSSRARRETK